MRSIADQLFDPKLEPIGVEFTADLRNRVQAVFRHIAMKDLADRQLIGGDSVRWIALVIVGLETKAWELYHSIEIGDLALSICGQAREPLAKITSDERAALTGAALLGRWPW